tara:strand:- start:60 stop:305 length:246 start_codon:yes stop_codon:yes gene_type:complete
VDQSRVGTVLNLRQVAEIQKRKKGYDVLLDFRWLPLNTGGSAPLFFLAALSHYNMPNSARIPPIDPAPNTKPTPVMRLATL